MSLQVWLPLNGTLENNGLLNYIPEIQTSTTLAYTDNGKIGKALSTGGIIMPAAITKQILNNSAFSYCCWIYPLGETGSTTQRAMIFGNDTMSTLGGRQFSLFQYPSCNDLHWSWQTCINGTYTVVMGGIKYGCLPSKTWTHLAVTFGNKTGKIYINGELLHTFSGTYNTDSFEFDTQLIHNSAYHYLNDIRLYNHCLSPKEVKEISKALILHYPLSDPFIEATTNLCTTGTLGNNAYNGSTGKYSYGTTTDIYKTTGTFQGKECTKVYMGTAGQSAYPYVWINDEAPAVGKYKIISFDYYPTTQDYLIPYSYRAGFIASYWDGVKWYGGISTSVTIPVVVNTWNHIILRYYNDPNDTTYSEGPGYMRIGLAGHTSTTTDYWLFANIQIEEKDHDTPYTSTNRAAINIIYDQGITNSYDGIIEGSINLSNESPRNSKSYHFESPGYNISGGLYNYIIGKCSISAMNKMTISFWYARTSSFNRGGYLSTSQDENFTDYTTTAFNSYDNNMRFNTTSSQYYNIATNSNIPSDGTWHHYTYVYNGSIIIFYKDGVQVTSVTTDGSTLAAFNYLGINYSKAGSTRRGETCNFSDVRIYATALSEDDIKELYHTSAMIDNNNNLFAYEFKEV